MSKTVVMMMMMTEFLALGCGYEGASQVGTGNRSNDAISATPSATSSAPRVKVELEHRFCLQRQ